MVISKTLHRQLMVALMAASVFVLTLSAAADRRFPRDELINRPDGTFACLPGEPMCDNRM